MCVSEVAPKTTRGLNRSILPISSRWVTSKPKDRACMPLRAPSLSSLANEPGRVATARKAARI
jgi:hypothetical protein